MKYFAFLYKCPTDKKTKLSHRFLLFAISNWEERWRDYLSVRRIVYIHGSRVLENKIDLDAFKMKLFHIYSSVALTQLSEIIGCVLAVSCQWLNSLSDKASILFKQNYYWASLLLNQHLIFIQFHSATEVFHFTYLFIHIWIRFNMSDIMYTSFSFLSSLSSPISHDNVTET